MSVRPPAYVEPEHLPSLAGAAGAAAVHPEVLARPVLDPGVLDRGRALSEAIRQTAPLAEAGTREAGQASRLLSQVTARPTGLGRSTARAQATRVGELHKLVAGPHPGGKAKEVIAALEYGDLHCGRPARMVNPPEVVSKNVVDTRLSPDASSKRDLLFQVRTNKGMILTVPGGQVKTGSSGYIADALVEMAGKPGYGRMGIVDARFVNADGTPRVAPDGFTAAQARRVSAARVRLRGVRDLDARGDALVNDIGTFNEDGVDPVARKRLEQLRDDIAVAYEPRGVIGRVATGAVVAAATAAVVSLVVQLTTRGEIDVAELRDASGKSALFGGVGAVADAAIYHGAVNSGLAPEAAKIVAQQGVAAGFCVLAIATDFYSEGRAFANGDVTAADAVAGGAFKAALDVLPLVLAPLGLVGLPVLVASQVGGRMLLARARESDLRILNGVIQARAHVADMDDRIRTLSAMADERDALFEHIMGATPGGAPQLRIVK